MPPENPTGRSRPGFVSATTRPKGEREISLARLPAESKRATGEPRWSAATKRRPGSEDVSIEIRKPESS